MRGLNEREKQILREDDSRLTEPEKEQRRQLIRRLRYFKTDKELSEWLRNEQGIPRGASPSSLCRKGGRRHKVSQKSLMEKLGISKRQAKKVQHRLDELEDVMAIDVFAKLAKEVRKNINIKPTVRGDWKDRKTAIETRKFTIWQKKKRLLKRKDRISKKRKLTPKDLEDIANLDKELTVLSEEEKRLEEEEEGVYFQHFMALIREGKIRLAF